jgi:hypothetical protein
VLRLFPVPLRLPVHDSGQRSPGRKSAAERHETMNFYRKTWSDVNQWPEPKRWTPWHGEIWVPAESLPIMSRQVSIVGSEIVVVKKNLFAFAFAGFGIRRTH